MPPKHSDRGTKAAHAKPPPSQKPDADAGTVPARDRRASEATGRHGECLGFEVMMTRVGLSKLISGWMNDDEAPACVRCDTPFTLFTRRHHC